MPRLVFADRDDAGRQLAIRLRELGFGTDGMVLGIPRGGIRVAAATATGLGLPLRAVLARKVGAPHQPELAIGSVGPDGDVLIDEELARRANARPRWLSRAVEDARRQVLARTARLPGVVTAADVVGRTTIVVDDGVATGATAAAVGAWLAQAGASPRILALPVGPPATLDRLAPVYDSVVALLRPEGFSAVGEWYRDFEQTTDDEVTELLAPD